jgi:hypothetical protein
VCDAYVVRQDSIERTPDGVRRPTLGNANAGGLAEGVNACVSAPGSKNRNSMSAQALQRVFKNSLNRPLLWLSLPARESRTIVLKNELQRFHC